MEYFNFIGALIACVLAILKIVDLLKNRPILKIRGRGGYDYRGQSDTLFHYSLTFENVGRRPAIIRKMNVDILDKKKKRLTIHSKIEHINKKLECPDVFEKDFEFSVNKKLPKETYFIQSEVVASGKNKKIKIRMRHADDILAEIFNEIEKGREKGLID